jgi:ribosome-binding factor A
MASKTLQRINEDIQRELAVLLRNIKDPRVNQGMISVTAVDTTSDLRHAKVFLSVYNLQSEKELKKGLKSAAGYLRHELGQSLNLRYTPELKFELDKSLERGARINTILNELDIPPDEAAEDGVSEEEVLDADG